MNDPQPSQPIPPPISPGSPHVQIILIRNLTRERDRTRQTAIADVSEKWGQAQDVYGPFLVVPYRYLSPVKTKGREPVLPDLVEAQATFLPQALRIDGELHTEVRYRGIFEAPVYRSTIHIEGSFDRPDFSGWDVTPERIFWERAQLIFEITDVRAIQDRPRLRWQENEIDFEPGTGEHQSELSGIHTSLAGMLEGSSFPFSCELELNGSSHLRFAPLGQETEVTLRADWSDPSFQGRWLPAERSVGAEGFTATWRIPSLGRNYPERWATGNNAEAVAASQFGVDLIAPVDAYRQTRRSLKYQFLFLGLTFVVIWLFEVLAGLRLHLIQYGLVGAAMCMFYLLELSLAEHLGFPLAYTIAAAAVVGLVLSYAVAMLRSRDRAALVGGVLVALYVCLYVLLQIQDYALLVGSVGLFLVLAAIMYATRNLDWHALRPKPLRRN